MQIAKLALEDGTVFTGKAFGAVGEVEGEVCFNTSMTGYQEILTDPSYRGQIVTMTYPEIGNCGINAEDVESRRPQLAGFIVREQAAARATSAPMASCTTTSSATASSGWKASTRGGWCAVCASRRRRRASSPAPNSTTPAWSNGPSESGLVGRDLMCEVVPDGPLSWSETLSHWTRLEGSAAESNT